MEPEAVLQFVVVMMMVVTGNGQINECVKFFIYLSANNTVSDY